VNAQLHPSGFHHAKMCAFSTDARALVLEGRERTLRALDVTSGRELEVTEPLRLAFQRAADFDSAFGWDVGAAPNEPGKLESQATFEMTLAKKSTGEPLAWIRLPSAHQMWTHPSGRIWALERYQQLHIYALEGA